MGMGLRLVGCSSHGPFFSPGIARRARTDKQSTREFTRPGTPITTVALGLPPGGGEADDGRGREAAAAVEEDVGRVRDDGLGPRLLDDVVVDVEPAVVAAVLAGEGARDLLDAVRGAWHGPDVRRVVAAGHAAEPATGFDEDDLGPLFLRGQGRHDAARRTAVHTNVCVVTSDLCVRTVLRDE